jgi:hypothetical protein
MNQCVNQGVNQENINQSKTIFVACDIEKAGDSLEKYPVVSLGFFVGDDKGNQLCTFHQNFQVEWYSMLKSEGKTYITNYGDFEPRCVNEYWTSGKVSEDVIKICKENAQPQNQAWINVGNFLENLETTYPSSKIKFLSDNPSYDIATIDYHLFKHTGREGLRYSTTGK